MSCAIGHTCGLDPVLLWLWRGPVVTAPIRPLAWEPPYATGAAQEMSKKKKKSKKGNSNSEKGKGSELGTSLSKKVEYELILKDALDLDKQRIGENIPTGQ